MSGGEGNASCPAFKRPVNAPTGTAGRPGLFQAPGCAFWSHAVPTVSTITMGPPCHPVGFTEATEIEFIVIFCGKQSNGDIIVSHEKPHIN